MGSELERRGFLGAAGAAVAAGLAAASVSAQEGMGKGLKILGIATSPRKGKTTAAAVQAALDAAKEAAPGVEIELVELAGMSIPAEVAAGIPLAEGQKDDFPAVAAKLSDPKVAGIIIGSPVYFNSMSGLCKAFIDRCMALRKNFALGGKVAGVLAVGGARNGGQELTIQSIQAALLSHEVAVVGTSRPTGRMGAALWNQSDDLTKDEFGLACAKDLGRHVAQVALRQAATK
ncbi:MAG TPA: flavodoxin family protein [Planctomycetota bacterium]|nr:flavodoxin family protein [Planctomycetota bacterium]HRR82441.1 flavodoxin family protein [Planctomycetota bacterium]HRT95711.1 flavodoxin family protein [Planctomycetota bacterium]